MQIYLINNLSICFQNMSHFLSSFWVLNLRRLEGSSFSGLVYIWRDLGNADNMEFQSYAVDNSLIYS